MLQQIQRVEVYFAAAIGVLMGLLGITLFQTSIIKLSEHTYDTHCLDEKLETFVITLESPVSYRYYS